MIKINKHIEIVSSSKGSLSSMGSESRNAVLGVLNKYYTKVSIALVNNLDDLEALALRKPDLVFLGMKFIYNDNVLDLTSPTKIWVTDYLERHNIAHTGSNRTAHEYEHNKAKAKQLILNAGLNTPRFCIAKQGQLQTINNMHLPFPVFIKPMSRGGGQGIDSNSVAYNFKQLRNKVSSIAYHFNSDSLIEEYLPGREFSVAIIKNEYSNGFFVMPIELIAQPNNRGARILSKQVKSSNSEQAIAVTDKIIKQRVNNLAIKVFHTLGASDYGRIDIRLDKSGRPHFLEANLIPSLIEGYGSFPKACQINSGTSHESMILNIVKLGLARSLEFYQEQLSENWLLTPMLT